MNDFYCEVSHELAALLSISVILQVRKYVDQNG